MTETSAILPGLDGVLAQSPQVQISLPPGPARIKRVDRNQLFLRSVDLEQLIEEDHPARAIWDFTGQLDLRPFEEKIEALAGVAGRACWDRRLLVSLWIYAYSRGLSSAREISRRCAYDPAFQWLCGMEVINYHTLSDFRVAHDKALTELFTQSLGVLSAEGLITLQRVVHDGTKIKACAGADSFRREETLQAHLQAAREQVQAMGDPRADQPARPQAARARAARERQQRLEQALEELTKIRENKNDAKAQESARASLTDPEARIMKQGDGGYAPSYNVQISTDAAHKIIVGVGLSQTSSDYGELMPAMERVEENLGKPPEQVVTDGGFTSRQNIVDAAAKGIDLIGSLDDHREQAVGQMKRRGVAPEFYPQAFSYDAEQDCFRCPAGEVLKYVSQESRPGVVHYQYRAGAGVCAACPLREHCCPQNAGKGRSVTRAVEASEVQAFKQKMQTPEAQAIYRQRGVMAEFPNAWIKDKLALRQFSVRGKIKARIEALWACLTYNIQQWIRLIWRPRQVASAGCNG
jgi:transposase